MRVSRRQALAVAIAITASVAALIAAALLVSRGKASEIGRDAAIVTAMSLVPDSSATATGARSCRLREFDPRTNDDPQRTVWAVFFSGSFPPASCGPPPPPEHPCTPPVTSMMVVLNRIDGSFLFGEAPVPDTVMR